jgi:H+/Na+-translocating ferredoxin:NAD+ oxidoreductase subunit E
MIQNLMVQEFINNDLPKGLLALAPFYITTASLDTGFVTGLIIAFFILLYASIIFLLKNLIAPHQRLAFILIVSISVILIFRLIFQAEAYSFTEKLGLFLPLLVINSLVISIEETIFSISDFKSVLVKVVSVSLIILLFFMILGFTQEIMADLTILSYPAGCFLLIGFLFAAINIFQKQFI